MDSYNHVAENLERIREGIAAAAGKTGRDPSTVSIMGVSKFHPPEAVRAAYAAGLRLFGENRVQEAAGKYPPLREEMDGLRVHMIGTLQSNKLNKALALFDGIQSIDSVEQLLQLLARVESRVSPISLFLELHTGEDSKAGFADEDSLYRACDAFAAWKAHTGTRAAEEPGVDLAGLMTMAPFTSDESTVRTSFSRLRRALENARLRSGLESMRELSMGMSNDFTIAVEEGSTIVRIGTALFGLRS